MWTRQNKNLLIDAHDLITDGDSNTETFNICKAKGITHLLYMAAAGNMCLTWTRGNSVINMANRGFKCAYMSDLMKYSQLKNNLKRTNCANNLPTL